MPRALLRLTLGAIVAAILFTIATLALGYLSIDILKLHAPMPAHGEFAVVIAGLPPTAPIVFDVTLLGMLLAWSDARRLPVSRIRHPSRSSIVAGVHAPKREKGGGQVPHIH